MGLIVVRMQASLRIISPIAGEMSQVPVRDRGIFSIQHNGQLLERPFGSAEGFLVRVSN